METVITPEQVEAAEAQIVEKSKPIEFYLTEFSVGFPAAKMRNGDFRIPDYQRADSWEPERQSRFVESLLRGLPLPCLFSRENPATGALEIVDGSQRQKTIEQFVPGHFDLPESRQKKIRNRSVRGIVLNQHADEQARFHLFGRINTGSMIANKAKVRRGALAGPFPNLVIELANDDAFSELAPVSDKQNHLRQASSEPVSLGAFAS